MRGIAAIEPDDVAGYLRFLDYSAGVYHEGYEKLGQVAFLDFKSMIKAAPSLARYEAWRSVYSIVSRYVKNEKLRQAFSFHTLLVGGNPMTTSAIYALIHKLEKDGGVWFPRGGTNALVAAMVKHFERLGGTVRMGDPVDEIQTRGDLATGVRTRSGWQSSFDAVASNGDVVHSYDLLKQSRPRRAGGAEAAAQAFLAIAVRGPFRGARRLSRNPASHDPVRAALPWPALGHLRPRRAVQGLLALPASPHGH
jgi:phytoene desaturase